MIDFDFRREARGLVMELQTATGGDSLFIPEDAFGFIEPCVTAAWPSYANHGHWGRTTISPSACSEIVGAMKALRQSLTSASQLSEVDGLGFLFSHLREEFSGDFDANRTGLMRMIDAICDWLEIWIARSISVTIVGV
jgi:hypothetical protein